MGQGEVIMLLNSKPEKSAKVKGTNLFLDLTRTGLKESPDLPSLFLDEATHAVLKVEIKNIGKKDYETGMKAFGGGNEKRLLEKKIKGDKYSGSLSKFSEKEADGEQEKQIGWQVFFGNEDLTYEIIGTYPEAADQQLGPLYLDVFSHLYIDETMEIDPFDAVSFTFDFKKFDLERRESFMHNSLFFGEKNVSDEETGATSSIMINELFDDEANDVFRQMQENPDFLKQDYKETIELSGKIIYLMLKNDRQSLADNGFLGFDALIVNKKRVLFCTGNAKVNEDAKIRAWLKAIEFK